MWTAEEDAVSYGERKVADRIDWQLSGVSNDVLKDKAIAAVAPIFAELRRRGIAFWVGSNGIDGAYRPNASTDGYMSIELLCHTVRLRTGE